MANRKVILLRYCKTENGWRRYPVAMGKNGRVRPGFVMVDGKPREYPEGYYVVRLYEGSKPLYKNVGVNAVDALDARNREAHLLVAKDSAEAAGAKLVEESGRRNLHRQLTRFVEAAEDRGARVAALAYRRAADEFLSNTSKTYADQITTEDVIAHQRALRKRGCSDRTISNRYRLVKSFLRFAGVPVASIMQSAPKYEKTLPEIYSEEEMQLFFGSLKRLYHTVIFELLLKTGLREQEAMFLTWTDISFASRTLTLHSKPEYGFKIKDKEERSLPIPSELLGRLREYRTEHPKAKFVLGTSADRPNTKLLRLLKRLVNAADLQCGVCQSCKTYRECEKWYLHKFRSTYATMLLRSGLDLRTVQGLMGHIDLESTMRYLRPQDSAHTHAKINSIQWGMGQGTLPVTV